MSRWRLAYYLGAVLWTVKPAVALAAAFDNPGCLIGHNWAGIPHVAPALMTVILLAAAWSLVSDRRVFFRIFAWLFFVGASMFATVPLARGLGFRGPQMEWPFLILAAAALAVRLAFAVKGGHPHYRRVSAFAAVVVGVTLFGSLVPPFSPLYVAAVALVGYGGLAALVTMLAWLHYNDRRSTP